MITVDLGPGGLPETADVPESALPGVLQSLGRRRTARDIVGRIYLTCDRCSKTVDLGLDRSNPDPIFIAGYCKRCSDFLLRQEFAEGHQRRLDSTVLVCPGRPSGAEAEAGRSMVTVGV